MSIGVLVLGPLMRAGRCPEPDPLQVPRSLAEQQVRPRTNRPNESTSATFSGRMKPPVDGISSDKMRDVCIVPRVRRRKPGSVMMYRDAAPVHFASKRGVWDDSLHKVSAHLVDHVVATTP